MGEEERGRAILLTGLMGSGKTSVGRSLAGRLGWSFIDTDERIEASSEMTVSEIFEREGEAGFRRRERDALEGLPGRACVVALGGGAVVDPANRELLRRKGRLVWLDASPERLAERIGDDPGRPLLAGLDQAGRVARLRALRSERACAYECAEYRIDTDGRGVEAVCEAVLAALGQGQEGTG